MTYSPAKRLSPYLFLAPFFVFFLVFQLFPILFSFVVSLTKWNGIEPPVLMGFRNYIRLVSDQIFWKSLLNTIIVIAIAIPLQFITGLLMAVLVSEYLSKRSKGVFQFINFMPYITAPVAVGIIFQIMFDWKYGTINNLLLGLGIIHNQINWFGQPWLARAVTAILSWWKYFGYMMVIFMAGLSTIPTEIYEAAKIEGARWRQTFFRITLPLLRPIITFVVTISIIGGLQMFDEPQLLFSYNQRGMPHGGPMGAVLTSVMNLYDVAFQRFEFGYGATVSYGLFVIIGIFSFITLRLLRVGKDE